MKTEAELLVKCGYSSGHPVSELEKKLGMSEDECAWKHGFIKTDHGVLPVDPYADTLEGKQQAESLWNHLSLAHTELWEKSYALTLKEITASSELFNNEMGKILYRIKWCCEQLNPLSGREELMSRFCQNIRQECRMGCGDYACKINQDEFFDEVNTEVEKPMNSNPTDELPPHNIYLLDTLEGRKEADVLETFLENMNFPIWEEAIHNISYDYETVNEWRLKRMEWCVKKIKNGIRA